MQVFNRVLQTSAHYIIRITDSGRGGGGGSQPDECALYMEDALLFRFSSPHMRVSMKGGRSAQIDPFN